MPFAFLSSSSILGVCSLTEWNKMYKTFDQGPTLKNQKNNKTEVKSITTYLVNRKFKGVITIDHAMERMIHTHIKQLEKD